MDNQHRKIKGYRELSEHEVTMMNKIKEHGEQLKELIDEIVKLRDSQLPGNYDGDPSEKPNGVIDLHMGAESLRCISIAEEKLQTGIMWLVRSIALPESF